MKYELIDHIVGEKAQSNNFTELEEEAERRLVIHNSHFYYKHRGVHEPANACIYFEENKIIIDYKRD